MSDNVLVCVLMRLAVAAALNCLDGSISQINLFINIIGYIENTVSVDSSHVWPSVAAPPQEQGSDTQTVFSIFVMSSASSSIVALET